MLILSNVLVLFNATDERGNVDFAFLIMEITTFFNYIFILYSARRIRILEKIEGE